MEMVKLGWVGLGKMGVPMVTRLLGAGYGVTVYNRDRAKAANMVAGVAANTAAGVSAAVAETPAKVSEAADIVFVMVSDDAATRAVFAGEDGLLKGGKNKIYVNMSSVSAEVSREMAEMAKVEGGAYVDAPVSGSVKQAEEGTLVVMVGAEPDLFERVKPVLSAMGKLVLNVGGTGVGNTAKLAINVLLAIHAQGLAESVVFARKHGVKAEDFLTIVNNSAMSNVFARIKGDAILKENYQAAFALKHIAKDLGLAKSEGLDTPLADTAYRTYTDAEPALGEEDIIAVIKAVGGR